jgi:trehalose 2-sulfotransferase
MPPNAQAYLIAALPRTGSFRLCELLAATGTAGYPQEYGDADDRTTWHGHHGFSHHVAYFHAFFRFCTTPNGVFGAKLMWPQFAALRRDISAYMRIDGRGLTQFETLIGPVSVVFLQRDNRLAQAISLYRAMATGAWTSRTPARGAEPPYDRPAIDRARDVIEANAELWEAFFVQNAIMPYRLSYEDIASDPEAVVRRVLDHLSLPPPHAPWRPGNLRPQADLRTQCWETRYLSEAITPNGLPAHDARHGTGGDGQFV